MTAPVDTPPPTAQGTLAKTPFPHLLVYTLERRLTGSIELRSANASAALILVHEGLPCKVRLADPVAYLGVVLHEMGLITDEQLNESLARMAAERRLHGQILLEMGAITQDGLLEGLRMQVVKKLEHLFSLPPDTVFNYYDGFDGLAGYGGEELAGVDSLPLVWAAIRQEPSWEHVHQALSRVDRAAMRLATTAQIERFKFTKQETTAAEMMRSRPVRLHELTSSKALSPSAAQLLVYCLMITKQIELVEAPSMRPPGAGATPAYGSVVRPSGQQQAVAQAQAFARVQLSKQTRNAPPAAPADIVEERSTELNFDPRRATPYPPPAVNLPPSARSDAPPASVRGMEAAPQSSPPSQRLASAPPASQRTPSVSAIPAAPPSSSRIPPAPPSSSRMSVPPAEVAAFRERIVKRAEEIDRLDYFQMLGIAKDAPTTEVQKAFFALAKTWHPDKLPQELMDVKDQCSKVFARLSEAHNTLTDPQKRQKYMQLVKEGGATPDEQAQVADVLEAVSEFQKAEFFIKRNDWAKAEEHVRRAYKLDSGQPDYIAALAWIEALKPENQSEEQTSKRIAMLDEAIKINANCAKAYFYRGMLLKRIDKMPAAYKDFKKAVELDEHNIDAAREVRLYNMRKQPGGSIPPSMRGSQQPPPPKGGGLFGKLFKK
jgi:hypothetical protein